MKRIINLIIVIILLAGCGSGGVTGSEMSEPWVNNDVYIYSQFEDGNVERNALSYFTTATQDMNEVLAQAPPYSYLVPDSPEFLGSFKRYNPIKLITTIVNNSPATISGYYQTQLEDISSVDREYWDCYRYFYDGEGTFQALEWLYVYEGGLFFNTIAYPDIPECSNWPDDSVCDTYPELDCLTAKYYSSYVPAEMGVEIVGGQYRDLLPGTTTTFIQNTYSLLRDSRENKYARVLARDMHDKLRAQKDYTFNISP